MSLIQSFILIIAKQINKQLLALRVPGPLRPQINRPKQQGLSQQRRLSLARCCISKKRISFISGLLAILGFVLATNSHATDCTPIHGIAYGSVPVVYSDCTLNKNDAFGERVAALMVSGINTVTLTSDVLSAFNPEPTTLYSLGFWDYLYYVQDMGATFAGGTCEGMTISPDYLFGGSGKQAAIPGHYYCLALIGSSGRKLFTGGSLTDIDTFIAGTASIIGPTPTAGTIIANDVDQTNTGDSSYSFTINYSDADGNLDTTSIGTTDVTACNGGTCASVISTGFTGTLSSLTVTYTVTPPGGTWDAADNGTYTIAILANEVADSYSVYVDADPNAGSFSVLVNTTTEPEIDVQRPAGASISDGGTDAQGNQNVGTQVTLTYTVSNSGSTELSVTNIASANPVNVSVDSISPTALSIVAGATGTFTLQYTPTTLGAFSFDLDISNDDADEGNYDIAISGTGVDAIPPAIEILDAPVSVVDNNPFTVTLEFSENVSGFVQSDITVGNGAATSFIALDDNTYTADITPDGNGDITIDVAASVAQDGAGNDNTAALQVSVPYGHIVLPPAQGAGSGEDVGVTYSATEADGVTAVSATLSLAISDSKLPPPPEAATSLVSAIDITSTSSVNGYILVVTFEIAASSDNHFAGFWKYGPKVSGQGYEWYDYGTLTANGDGTGYEISTDQKSLSIYLIDGVLGDIDWLVNAAITDPGLALVRPPQTVFKDGFEASK